ncbi:hypothetical protein Tco_1213074 [Tanacetum coccineum]
MESASCCECMPLGYLETRIVEDWIVYGSMGSVRCSCFFLRGTSMENKGELGIGEVNLGVVAVMSSTVKERTYAAMLLLTCHEVNMLILMSLATFGALVPFMDTLSVMCDLIEVDNSPNDSIVQFVDIHDNPSSYVGAAEGSKLEPSKLKSLTMGVPLIDESGFTIEIVSIEYEWKPPCCDLCKIFGHVLEHCPKGKLVGQVPSTVCVTYIVVIVTLMSKKSMMVSNCG